MKKNAALLALVVVLISACATMSYQSVLPGVNSLGALQVNADTGWNLAPAYATPRATADSQTWTKDGLLLDRLILIPAVKDGEALFVSDDPAAALPPFRANMLPNEIEEMTESTIVKLFGEGEAAVSTEKLRPWGFAEHRGVMFDISVTVTESPDYRGMVGAFIVEEKLYMIVFLAATPHYYDKHVANAEALIKGAQIRVPTVPSAGG
ncbi:MAG: hypothetical protein L0Y45_04410 [Woeseiaceae bacterium]|nr:hypothetical protein [Woeseiaceae bacterium]